MIPTRNTVRSPLQACARSSNPWRILLLLAAAMASTTTTAFGLSSSSRPKFLYRTMDPPSASEPIIEYYNPEVSEDKEDFPDFLYSPDISHHRVVEFYSPMCPHCRHFAPHYVEFARHFEDLTRQNSTEYTGLDVRFYAVSCLAYHQICRGQKVDRYPTVKIFQAGSTEGIYLRYGHLHPMTLLKTLGISAVDSITQQENSEESGEENAVEKNNDKQSTTLIPPFQKRSQRDVFNDAYLSLHTALKTSVFMVEGPLSPHRATTLRQFLELLQKVLPAWKAHAFIRALLKQEKFAQDEKAWNGILKQFAPQQKEWSEACQLHESPYTCGLWSLFHIATVGVVEYNSNIVDKEAKYAYLQPTGVADTLKNFIVTFFTCTECVEHFGQEYEQCLYGRCERLKEDAFGPDSRNDWKEVPLWLLETHNGINIRLQRERSVREGKPQLPTPDEQQSVMWPPVEECAACWIDSSGANARYNSTMMFQYLRLTYW